MRDTIAALLAKKGFDTSSVASERERTPGVQSEVCMVYASRPQQAAPAPAPARKRAA
jgi:hypothetical protein